jgi:hypothetical protein
MGNGSREALEEATLQLQGREVRGVRYIQRGGSGANGFEGAGIALDIGPESGAKMIVLQILRTGGEDKITETEVRDLLKPFHVGPDR